MLCHFCCLHLSASPFPSIKPVKPRSGPILCCSELIRVHPWIKFFGCGPPLCVHSWFNAVCRTKCLCGGASQKYIQKHVAPRSAPAYIHRSVRPEVVLKHRSPGRSGATQRNVTAKSVT